MKIFYSSKFAREYRKLLLRVKKIAEKKEQIFRKNPFDPRLKTHKLKGSLKGFLSFSINQKYRIIFEFLNSNTRATARGGDERSSSTRLIPELSERQRGAEMNFVHRLSKERLKKSLISILILAILLLLGFFLFK